ncbi:MAG: YdcF family protein [Clostridia bacterium]|nr:YdcF family protein [Clostridia bacterium]
MEKRYLSLLTDGEIENLPVDKKTEIIYGKRGMSRFFDVAVVLGSSYKDCVSRAGKAFELYKEGRVKKIVVSGGVIASGGNGVTTECEAMRDILLSLGVLSGDILLENEAENTAENLFYSSALIQRELINLLPYKVAVVTSSPHVLRSVLLAKAIMPSYSEVYGVGSDAEGERKQDWFTCERGINFVTNEIKLVKTLIERKVADDIVV